MRTFIITLFCLLCCACSNNAANTKRGEELIDKMLKTDDEAILGNWLMCQTSGKYGTVQLNVCPTISFKNNGIGSVSKNGVVTENFTWTLKKGLLTIAYTYKINEFIFSNANYIAMIDKEKNGINLILHQMDSGDGYYLSRLF